MRASTADEVKTLRTITRHITLVQASMQAVILELNYRSLVHDESKYRDDEFSGFARINGIARTYKYGSDAYMSLMEKERPTIDLHYSRNSHHPEFFDHPSSMGLFGLIEMVCDWRAAWQVYDSEKPEDERMTWQDSMKVNRKRFTEFTEAQWFVIEEIADFLEMTFL